MLVGLVLNYWPQVIHCAQPNFFVFLVEMGFHNVGQAGLKLLALNDLPIPPPSFPKSWDYRCEPPHLDLGFFFLLFCLFVCLFFGDRVLLCHPGWSAVVRSQLTATSACWVQVILLPQLPE